MITSYFNPRTPCGVRPQQIAICLRHFLFQSTHPVWGATIVDDYSFKLYKISIHAPRVGCDAISCTVTEERNDFNPRTPCGVRRCKRASRPTISYFNPRTPCGVRHRGPGGPAPGDRISIHAPRVGCDQYTSHGRLDGWDFNPRTPCGVRLFDVLALALLIYAISIHAPRVGCDGVTLADQQLMLLFQSTHPVWGATIIKYCINRVIFISIHAPRVGCDLQPARTLGRCPYFNPRTPCGVRHPIGRIDGALRHFNPRTPCGVRRGSPSNPLCIWAISIHAPRVGCDIDILNKKAEEKYFNPRTPCGVRP